MNKEKLNWKLKQEKYALYKLSQLLIKAGKKNAAKKIIARLCALIREKSLNSVKVSSIEPKVLITKSEKTDNIKFLKKVKLNLGKELCNPMVRSSKKIIDINTDKIKEDYGYEVHFILTSIQNVRPLFELKKVQKSKYRGTRNQQKVSVTTGERSIHLAIKWLIQGAQEKTDKSFGTRLYKEFLDAYEKKGSAMRKKHALYRACYTGFSIY